MRLDFLTAVDPSVSPVERPALLAALNQEKFRLAEERDKERRLDQREERDGSENMINVMLIAELDRIEEAELRVRMEQHEHALIEALIANEEALADAQRAVDRMLGEAYVLPDGRRVFKTEDGQRVFDENGRELVPDEVVPAEIGEEHPTWEKYGAAVGARDGLAAERQELLDYQRKLDTANEKMAAGTMSDADLADLDRLMTDDVPEAVRRRLSSDDIAPRAPAGVSTLDGQAEFFRRDSSLQLDFQ